MLLISSLALSKINTGTTLSDFLQLFNKSSCKKSIAQWLAFLLPDPADPGPNHSSGGFFGKNSIVAVSVTDTPCVVAILLLSSLQNNIFHE